MRHTKGFTLVETIVVLVILAILAAIFIPSMAGWIDRSNEKVCRTSQSKILQYYRYVQTLEYGSGTDVALSDVLAGHYEVCAQDVAACVCPTGGTYTADNENEIITCSRHGALPEDGSEGEDEEDEEDEETGTKDYFYLAGDASYRVTTWGDLEEFNPEHDGQPGTLIPTGAVFFYQDQYYLFRDYQYFTKSTDIPSFVSGYGIKINKTGFTTPSASTNPGDIKLQGGKTYVFFPYSRFPEDYLNSSCWYEITITP